MRVLRIDERLGGCRRGDVIAAPRIHASATVQLSDDADAVDEELDDSEGFESDDFESDDFDPSDFSLELLDLLVDRDDDRLSVR